MALNIAVPFSNSDDLLEDFNLKSPIGMESRESLKILCSPIGSESSGVSSLDSEEIKVMILKLCVCVRVKKKITN